MNAGDARRARTMCCVVGVASSLAAGILSAESSDHGSATLTRDRRVADLRKSATRIAREHPGPYRLRTRSNLLLADLLSPNVRTALGGEVSGDVVPVAFVSEDRERGASALRGSDACLMAAAESGTPTGWEVPSGWVSVLDGTTTPASHLQTEALFIGSATRSNPHDFAT